MGSGVHIRDMQRGISFVLGRPGSDLLSQGLSHSTIGAEEFNGRVRDGIGFMLLARTTRPAKDKGKRSKLECVSIRAQSPDLIRGPTPKLSKGLFYFSFISMDCRVKPGNDKRVMDTENESNQANRTISTGKLHALPHFHTRPINVVVFHGSQGNARFEVGFPLRCFQRLSRPYIAMQHCRWRDNCSTRGTFIPVLSY
jgi:hypothetical protein